MQTRPKKSSDNYSNFLENINDKSLHVQLIQIFSEELWSKTIVKKKSD